MEVILHILWQWTFINAIALPLALLLGTSVARVTIRSSRAPMAWTHADEINDHPLIEKTGRKVRYLGGLAYPLHWKFAFLHALWFPLFFVTGMSTVNVLRAAGLSLAWGLACEAFVLLIIALVLHKTLRRLQPRWLSQHLATLPADARPPATEEVASAIATP